MLQNATIRYYYLQLNEYKTDYSVKRRCEKSGKDDKCLTELALYQSCAIISYVNFQERDSACLFTAT